MKTSPSATDPRGGGLDVVVTLPAPVVDRIEAQAKERGEMVAGWHRGGLVEGTPEVSLEELVFDVRMALLRAPATRGMDELAMGILADGIVKHLARSRLRFLRMAPLPLHSAGYRPEPVGAALAVAGLEVQRDFDRAGELRERIDSPGAEDGIRRVFVEQGWSSELCDHIMILNNRLPPGARIQGVMEHLHTLRSRPDTGPDIAAP